MKNFFREQKIKTILLSLLMITFGVLFIVFKESSFDVAVKVLAWILIVVGALWLCDYFIWFKDQDDSSQFVSGMMYLGFGLLMLFIPELYLALIGIAVALAGLQYIGASFDENRLKVKDWWKTLLYGIIEFAIGTSVIALRYSGAAHAAIMIYAGVALIVNGLFILCALFTIKRKVNKIKKEMAEE